jgi:predicted transcriptional regulator
MDKVARAILEKNILETLGTYHMLKVSEITSHLNHWKGYDLERHQVKYVLTKLEKQGKVACGMLNSRLYQLKVQ